MSRSHTRLEVDAAYPRLVETRRSGANPEAALWQAQTELILNAAGEGIYGLDLHGRCTFVNPAAARMTGHSIDELLGESMHDIVHHSHCDGAAYAPKDCPIYAAFADGMVRNVCDEVFWRKDGTPFSVEYTSTPIFNGKDLVGAVVVFRDITRRCQTEDRLRGALREVERLKERLQLENTNLRQEIEHSRSLQEIVGGSAAMRDTLRLIGRVAPTDSTVLVLGETGTGKELIARAIHRLSPRHEKPLIRVNCGAIAPQLVDSELFGHERGAFTGALQRRAGRFEQAEGGTLFLDEVGELPPETQSRLLRVLQEREFERVGGNDTLKANVRVVAATHCDLRALVKRGIFRADLFFRLNVVPLSVPPLRSRTSDIPALVERFLHQLEIRVGRELGRVSEAGMRRLAQYHWPGNVRELQNVVEHAAVLGEGHPIEIPPELLSFGEPEATSAVTSLCEGGVAALDHGERAVASPPAQPATLTLQEVERRHILQVLEKTKWRLSGPSGASAILGLHTNTLRHRMNKLGIRR